MKKLPVSAQSFIKIITGNYTYIDKTEHIYRLIENDCCFFARPRRFGKSLLCSTLKSLFLGQKELFKGLWIERESDYTWPFHPVVHIDFLNIPHKTPEELDVALTRYLAKVALSYDLPSLAITTPNEMLGSLIEQLKRKYATTVVIIIDEYDKPILTHLHNMPVAKQIREVLKSFYEVIKGLDEYLRFVFITGVSRFSQTSIFSGLNQLLDISMNPDFAHLVGCTEEELKHVFVEHLATIAQGKEISTSVLIDKMRLMYNGYRFWKNVPLRRVDAFGDTTVKVFNPFSIVNALHAKSLENFWFLSGTPTFLINLLQERQYPVIMLENVKADQSELGTFDIEHLPLTTLLFQTGYLTIKSYDEETKNFTLGYPNNEVQEAFLNNILKWMANVEHSKINAFTTKLLSDLTVQNTAGFMQALKEFYAHIPYDLHIAKEKYYQTVFFTVLKLIGAVIDVEITTNIGRIDAVVETKYYLYIIEFKINKKASVALEQIREKQYFERYLSDQRQIVLMGISFDTALKNIGDFLVEVL